MEGGCLSRAAFLGGVRNIVVGLSHRKFAFVHLPTNQIFASQTKRASERDLVPSERETGF